MFVIRFNGHKYVGLTLSDSDDAYRTYSANLNEALVVKSHAEAWDLIMEYRQAFPVLEVCSAKIIRVYECIECRGIGEAHVCSLGCALKIGFA